MIATRLPLADFLDDVSGTNGLAGSMDTILKRVRGSNEGTLRVAGRDVDETTYKVVFSDSGKWIAGGSDLADATPKVSQDRLGEQMQSTLAAVEHSKDLIPPREGIRNHRCAYRDDPQVSATSA